MSDPDGLRSVDPGLVARFRAAGAKVAWRDAPGPRRRAAGSTTRIAHLHDEEARVETTGTAARLRVAVDSGPLGALVLLLEIDRRGAPSDLGAAEAGGERGFSSGAIVAGWGGVRVPHDSRPTLPDLVELARYALA